MEPLAKDIIGRHDRLKSERGTWENQWQQIAELIRPMRADFTAQRPGGERRGLEIYDSTPGLANENLAAGLWGMITNSATTWFMLEHPDEAINQDFEVRAWNDAVADIMRNEFESDGQAFYARALDFYADISAFGTAIMFVDEGRRGRIRFSTRRLSECVIAESDEEEIDTVYRKFAMTNRQACQRWGNKAPERARKGFELRPDDKIEIIHAVYPNADRKIGRMDARGKEWASAHVSCEGEVIQQGGYDDFPYLVSRWSTATRSLYGESPAMLALADIKTLNVMAKTFLVASQKAADPPLLAADENAIGPVRMAPGGVVYGAVDANGRALIQTLQTGANFQLTDAMLEQKRFAIREAFYGSLLQMVQRPNATATEVLARQEEQLRLMGPHLGRLQSEFLDPLIARVFNLKWRAGALPPLPPALAASPIVQAEYVSPLARAQKAGEAGAILRTLESVLPLAQTHSGVMDNFDMDATVRATADGYSAPNKIMRDPRLVERDRQARAQAQQQQAQQQQMLEAAKVAPGVASAAKELGLAGAPA